MNYYFDVLKKYAVFSGRATRKEYWMFVLYNILIGFVIGLVAGIVGIPKSSANTIGTVYSLAILIPSLAVIWRRLHDTGRSGGWFFIAIIPVIGWIVLIIFLVQASKHGENKYGQI